MAISSSIEEEEYISNTQSVLNPEGPTGVSDVKRGSGQSLGSDDRNDADGRGDNDEVRGAVAAEDIDAGPSIALDDVDNSNNDEEMVEDDVGDSTPTLRRSQRNCHSPDRYGEWVMAQVHCSCCVAHRK